MLWILSLSVVTLSSCYIYGVTLRICIVVVVVEDSFIGDYFPRLWFLYTVVSSLI